MAPIGKLLMAGPKVVCCCHDAIKFCHFEMVHYTWEWINFSDYFLLFLMGDYVLILEHFIKVTLLVKGRNGFPLKMVKLQIQNL